MKVVVVGVVLSSLAFVAMGLQMGVLGNRPRGETPPAEEDQPPPPPKEARAKFPEDLAPCARAEAVPRAAEFKFGPVPHPLVFLRMAGDLHPWHDSIREEWQADSVAATQLAVIVGTPKKIFVNRIDYPNGAPPITRYVYELEISVIEAKTGKIVANRLFRNVPREIMRVEAWETTAIGRAVTIHQVFNWVANTSKTGFPVNHDPTPIITQAD